MSLNRAQRRQAIKNLQVVDAEKAKQLANQEKISKMPVTKYEFGELGSYVRQLNKDFKQLQNEVADQRAVIAVLVKILRDKKLPDGGGYQPLISDEDLKALSSEIDDQPSYAEEANAVEASNIIETGTIEDDTKS